MIKQGCALLLAGSLVVLNAEPITQLLSGEILNTDYSSSGADALSSPQDQTITLRCRFVGPTGNIDDQILIQGQGQWSEYAVPHPLTSVFLSAEDYQTVLNRCITANPKGESAGEALTDIVTVPFNNFSHDVYFSNLGRENIYPFDRVIFFGDSLSDNSDDFRYYSVIMKALFPGIYWNKRFSNGWMWTDWLTTYNQVPNGTGFNLPHENFAYAGAYSFGIREHIIPDLPTQITSYLNIISDNHLGADQGRTLFSVLIGANDFLSTNHTPQQVADVVSAQLYRLTASTLQQGASKVYLLVPTIPDISETPSQLESTPERRAQEHQDVETYNALVTQDLIHLQYQAGFPAGSVVVFRPDFEGYLNQAIANAKSLNLNVTDRCMTGARWGSSLICSDPQDHAFWDGLHPSATMSCMLGQKVTDSIQSQLQLPLTYSDTDITDPTFANACRYTYIQP